MEALSQDAVLVPDNDVSGCAMTGKCELIFSDKASNREKGYEVLLMNAKDIELSKAVSIVLEKHEFGQPFFAGLVAEGFDANRAVKNIELSNTYTSYMDKSAVEIFAEAFATESSVITDGDSGDLEKKPPPKCPPKCSSYIFVPADQYLYENATSLKAMMELPALIPVLVPK